MMRGWSLVGLLVVATSLPVVDVQAQTLRAQAPRGQYKPPPSAPRQPYNSMARDTTPFNCEQYRAHPHPGMVGFCEGLEHSVLKEEARRQGRPGASASVIALPAMGTTEARELGYACIGGQAMRRLANGWEQVMAREGGWQRCRGG
ncbi:putative secreted protein [Pseudoxanthomonas suwonensis 11-1]|uniref:Putative secreted protein n=1 Tax=Pseudoxanthomonas suwonensis (strain 11-1) TaxID=743721 RepID=E6WTG3_PSEUU|nr:hypothetical protein [Pseudoxanthomonas suwonensis]ADV27462.1 putative secreted protein [Pseudoxanthomonas suwonensis 11-1]